MNQADCQANGGTWGANHKTGNHNLVVGPQHNYSNSGGVVFGLRNTVNRDSSAVTGGQNGVAGGPRSSITGGNDNKVGIRFSTISGGFLNEIRFDPAHVFGASVISGGSFNLLQSGEAVIGGGSGCSLTAPLGWGAKTGLTSGSTSIGDCQ
jgi:hypothetical protein